jgi:hypothetical protein
MLHLKHLETMTQVVGLVSPNARGSGKRPAPTAVDGVPTQARQALSLSEKRRRTTYALAIHTAMDVDTSGDGVRAAVLTKVPEQLQELVDMHIREQVYNHDGEYPWHAQAQQIADTIVGMEDALADEAAAAF